MSLQQAQAEYYTRTASLYDTMHVKADDEHFRALAYISSFLPQLQVSSTLDVGCGTGRGISYLIEKHPGMDVHALEPVQALIDEAISRNPVLTDRIVRGRGDALPFADQSFDAVCELGVLHHVQDPNRVVAEMLRVARKAIFLSDSNRFGQGPFPARLLKLFLHRLGLWPVANFIKTKGKGYTWSEGDGLGYSYSVFDSLRLLARWADRIILIPTGDQRSTSWHQPLLTSRTVLVCAIREGSLT